MGLQRFAWIALRSLLAMAMAVAVMVLANHAGGTLADWSGFPAGNDGRLAWDLGCFFLAGVFATAVLARLAPRAPRAHALAFGALLLVVIVLGVARLGGDWPRWFSAGLLLGLPLQLWLGAGGALRGKRVTSRPRPGSAGSGP